MSGDLERPADWESMDTLPGPGERLIIASEDPQISDRRAALVSKMYLIVSIFGLLIMLEGVGLFVIFLQVQQLDTAVSSMQATADTIQRTADTIQRETLTNRENGLRTRAVNCQILVSLGEVLPPQCLEPAVVALYDPEAVPTAGADSPGQQANRALLCGLYDQLDLSPPPGLCED